MKFKQGDKVIYGGEVWTISAVDPDDQERPYKLLREAGRWGWVREYELTAVPSDTDAPDFSTELSDMAVAERFIGSFVQAGNRFAAKFLVDEMYLLVLSKLATTDGPAAELAKEAIRIGKTAVQP